MGIRINCSKLSSSRLFKGLRNRLRTCLGRHAAKDLDDLTDSGTSTPSHTEEYYRPSPGSAARVDRFGFEPCGPQFATTLGVYSGHRMPQSTGRSSSPTLQPRWDSQGAKDSMDRQLEAAEKEAALIAEDADRDAVKKTVLHLKGIESRRGSQECFFNGKLEVDAAVKEATPIGEDALRFAVKNRLLNPDAIPSRLDSQDNGNCDTEPAERKSTPLGADGHRDAAKQTEDESDSLPAQQDRRVAGDAPGLNSDTYPGLDPDDSELKAAFFLVERAGDPEFCFDIVGQMEERKSRKESELKQVEAASVAKGAHEAEEAQEAKEAQEASREAQEARDAKKAREAKEASEATERDVELAADRFKKAEEEAAIAKKTLADSEAAAVGVAENGDMLYHAKIRYRAKVAIQEQALKSLKEVRKQNGLCPETGKKVLNQSDTAPGVQTRNPEISAYR
ncbi:hypothetical protein BJ508DRAFT_155256 [Ascobolus immersus RN42]|uniref:Uncharacterized protein n=1 Tax=Ascobolus immersus RN42 TaxID=1160509 RepID=A0A3N4HXX6_ASCIM|nr:hypothetical protein BJ508DRAFT_155256 [Ascobolus immersus RN42]